MMHGKRQWKISPVCTAWATSHRETRHHPLPPKTMNLLLLIIILLLLFGGGGGYYAHRAYGGAGLGGVLGLVLVIMLVLFLFGGLHA